MISGAWTAFSSFFLHCHASSSPMRPCLLKPFPTCLGEAMNRTRLLLLSTVCILLSGTIHGASAMSLSDLGKVCLFSGISGVIELNGKPAAHVRLVRRADTKTDETTTDENGYSEFPPSF